MLGVLRINLRLLSAEMAKNKRGTNNSGPYMALMGSLSWLSFNISQWAPGILNINIFGVLSMNLRLIGAEMAENKRGIHISWPYMALRGSLSQLSLNIHQWSPGILNINMLGVLSMNLRVVGAEMAENKRGIHNSWPSMALLGSLSQLCETPVLPLLCVTLVLPPHLFFPLFNWVRSKHPSLTVGQLFWYLIGNLVRSLFDWT